LAMWRRNSYKSWSQCHLGFKLVTHSRIQGKRKEKSPKRCGLVVTGPTGDRHRSDRCKPSKST
jgi:hypothetical protein